MAIIPVVINSGGGALAPLGSAMGVLLAIGVITLYEWLNSRPKKRTPEEIKYTEELKRFEEETYLEAFLFEKEMDGLVQKQADEILKKIKERKPDAN